MTAPSPAEPAVPTPSLRGSVIRGTIWMVGAQWATRGLGLLSTAILARLLAPQDFGLMAMATVVAGFLGVLFTFGIDTALIQNTNATRADWDTAWSVRVGQGIILAVLVAMLAPVAARVYDEPRVTMIMLVLSGGIVIASFGNIGVVAFRRDLQFHRDFQFTLAQKVLGICVTIPLALVFRSYWALLAGTVAGQIFTTAFSYLMHPFRPRWSLARAKEILGFTSWMAFINLSVYITLEGERLIIGALTGARQTGIYAVSSEMAGIPTAELSGSISRATVPGFAKLKHDRERLRSGYLNVFGFVALFSFPAGAGIAVVAPELVGVMLGSQWADAIPLVRLLAIAGALRALSSSTGNLLIVLGRLNAAALVSWLQAISQILLLLPAIRYFGLIGAGALNCVLAAITAILYVAQVVRFSDASTGDHLAAVWRPLLSTAVMAVTCHMTAGMGGAPAASLALTILVGVFTYALASLSLWLLCGRPRGPERHLLEMVAARLRFG